MAANLVFLGPSGAGKSSLMLGLSETQGEYDFTIDRPWTTRQRRPGEGDKEYVFTDKDTFDRNKDRFLFTMKTYGDYEFGLEKPGKLSEKELKMRILLPGNALKFRELIEDPVIFCAIRPRDGFSVRDTLLNREPGISAEDLGVREARVKSDMEQAEKISDVVYQNVDGLEVAVAGIRDALENYLRERNL